MSIDVLPPFDSQYVVTMGDALANPVAPAAGSYLLAWDGASWRRVRADGTYGITVDVSRMPAVALQSVGNVGDDTTDSGNPVKIGGTARSTPRTAVTIGNRVDAYFDDRGRLGVFLSGGNSNCSSGNPGDGVSGSVGFDVRSHLHAFSGVSTTSERVRNNQALTLLASAARTTTTSSPDQTSPNARGCEVFLNVTAIGTGSITLKIETKDPVSGNYFTLVTGGVVAGNGLTRYAVYPGIQAVINSSVSDCLGRTWRTTVTANNANAVTYSVGGHLLL